MVTETPANAITPGLPSAALTFFDAVGSAIWIYDASGMRYVNRAFCNMTGYTREELLPLRAFRSIFVPAYLAGKDRQAMERLHGSGMPAEDDVPLITRDGRELWLRVHANSVVLEGHKLVIVSGSDITSHRETERSLRDNREWLEIAQGAGQMGSWQWEIRTNRVSWSPSLEALHGLAPGAFAGTFDAFEADIHPEDRSWVRAAIDEALRSGEHSVDYRIVLPSGELRWLAARGRIIHDETGQPERLVGICMDVTERKRSDDSMDLLSNLAAALAGSLNFDETLDRLAVALVPRFADWCAVDIQGERAEDRRTIVVHADPGYAGGAERLRELLGERAPGTPSLLAHRRDVTIYPDILRRTPEDPAARMAQTVLVDGLGTTSLANAVLRCRGRQHGRLLLGRTAPERRFTRDDQGLLEHIGRRTAISIDNALLYQTARRNEEEAREASSAKDEFLALISHELKNPLTSLLGLARLLGRRFEQMDRADVIESLMIVTREGNRLQAILENMLVLSRGEFEAAEFEPIHFPHLLRDVVGHEREAHPERKIVTDIPSDLPIIVGYPIWVAQILTNLITNADKYSPPDQPITIRARAQPGGVEIVVADRGPGVEPDEADRLFDPFYRSPSAQTAVGMGLGLTVCRRLVAAMNGTIGLYARPDPPGAEVRFTLPAEALEESGE